MAALEWLSVRTKMRITILAWLEEEEEAGGGGETAAQNAAENRNDNAAESHNDNAADRGRGLSLALGHGPVRDPAGVVHRQAEACDPGVFLVFVSRPARQV